MDLKQFPRRRYTSSYTPIETLTHFSEKLDGPTIHIKRDDLLGLTAGGNKTRKLEFIIADAMKNGADTIITCGGVQSNHCRLTLAAAIKEKLNCILVLEEGIEKNTTSSFRGNFFLFHLMGGENIKVVPNGTDLMEEMEVLAHQVKNQGHNPYIIPFGGSNSIGATGYADCAQEILEQSIDQGLDIDAVVCVSGSGGMQAGLITGFYGNQSSIPVLGINVIRGKVEQEKIVHKLVQGTAEYIGLSSIPFDTVNCFDDYVGPGYAVPTHEMVEAVQLMAKTEGVLLDPVYTGKAVAGLIDLSRKGYFKKSDNVLFVHSGGSPALFANTSLFD